MWKYVSPKRIYTQFIVGWALAMILWMGLRTPGLVPVDDPHYDWIKSLLILPPFIILAGLVYGTIAYWVETRLYGAMSLKSLSLIVVSAQTLATLLLFVIGFLMYESVVTPNMTQTLREAMISPTGITFMIYSFFTNLAIIFFREISLMIGPIRLGNIFMGRYYSPSEEYVVFLFMDLKSSVTTAQALGAQKYSRLIQDCFKDISVTDPLGAHIYQYIGDEVVLCWYMKPSDSLDICVQAWDHFIERINHRRDYYQREYGDIPVFRGGLHAGKVITAEIGVARRDIAHHGHTINLAARVQEFGKHSQEDLVLTQEVYDKLSPLNQNRCQDLGFCDLRNIGDPVRLYEC